MYCVLEQDTSSSESIHYSDVEVKMFLLCGMPTFRCQTVVKLMVCFRVN